MYVNSLLIAFLLEIPIYIPLFSWFTGGIVQHIPLSVESPHRKGVPLFQPGNVRSIAGD